MKEIFKISIKIFFLVKINKVQNIFTSFELQIKGHAYFQWCLCLHNHFKINHRCSSNLVMCSTRNLGIMGVSVIGWKSGLRLFKLLQQHWHTLFYKIIKYGKRFGKKSFVQLALNQFLHLYILLSNSKQGFWVLNLPPLVYILALNWNALGLWSSTFSISVCSRTFFHILTRLYVF